MHAPQLDAPMSGGHSMDGLPTVELLNCAGRRLWLAAPPMVVPSGACSFFGL